MPLQYQSGWVLWAILGCLAAAWQSMINANVPKAYLVSAVLGFTDVHFLIRVGRMNISTYGKHSPTSWVIGIYGIQRLQPRLACMDINCPKQISTSDSKLTFLRYIIAYALLTLWPAPRPDGLFHASSFRLANMVPWSTCMPPLVLKVLDLFCSSSNHLSIFRVQGLLSDIELSHTMFNICLFPPLFFFTGLFYTDALSATSVLLAYKFYLKRQKKPLVVSALVSLVFRQTNIFWVAVFLGGLEVCRTLRKGRSGIEFPAKATFSDVISGSWRHSCVYDPEIHSAHFEGPTFCLACY